MSPVPMIIDGVGITELGLDNIRLTAQWWTAIDRVRAWENPKPKRRRRAVSAPVVNGWTDLEMEPGETGRVLNTSTPIETSLPSPRADQPATPRAI